MPLLDESYYKSQIPKSYQKGFIHPDFKPYTSLNEYPHLHPSVEPSLLNYNKGWDFKLLDPNDQCPWGFDKDIGTGSCIKQNIKSIPLPYSKTNYAGYGRQPRLEYTRNTSSSSPATISKIVNSKDNNSTTFRSADPVTGEWNIFYKNKPSKSAQKYVNVQSSNCYL